MNGLLLRDLAELPNGKVKATDLLDLLAPHIREFDVETWCPERPSESGLFVPTGLDAVPRSPYRRLTDGFLVPNDTPPVERLIRELPNPYLEPYRYLQREYGIDIPVGMEELGIFMVLAFQADPAALQQSTIEHAVYTENGTTSWVKPTGATLRFTSILLIGSGGGSGSGAKVLNSGNQAAGGGGGGGGGCITRIVNLATLSTGNVVRGNASAGGVAQTSNDTNGNNGTDGLVSTFAGLSAGGGVKGTGGGQGAGAQTGAGGAGGSGDITGSAGGAGASGATAGTQGTDNTIGPAGAGGGGGGGATADTAQGTGGRGGRGWFGAGQKGTVGGATGPASTGRGEGGGGGAGNSQSATNATAGGDCTNPPNMAGGGGGGGGGRARNAIVATGDSGAGATSGKGFAAIITF